MAMSLKMLALFVVVLVAIVSYIEAEEDADTRFLGLGYDIVRGNPDGDFKGPSATGTDPGIRSLRRILMVSDDKIQSIARSSCVATETVYENSAKYQKKLELEINVEAGASFWGVSFSASAGFQQANEQTTESESVVFEKLELCKKGGVRYLEELVDVHDFTVDDTFAAAVCNLPRNYDSSSKATYMRFIADWGTHFITTVYLGTKVIERSEATRTQVFEFAEENYSAAISVEGSYGGFGGSLSVDVDSFRSEESFKSEFNSNKATYIIGTDDLPEPIQLSLYDILLVLDEKYWSHLDDLKTNGFCDSNFDLSHMKSQLEQALEEYPEYIVTYPVNHDAVVVPLTWPEGTYGMVAMIGAACPTTGWHYGFRYHFVDTRTNVSPDVSRSVELINLSYRDGTYALYWGYCMQLYASGRRWPKGSYCIFKKGACPGGFEPGFIFIDDKGQRSYYGYYPDGEYTDTSTKIEYCCRNDNFAAHKIFLPTEKPFVLQPSTEYCQEVHGMKWSKITVFIDGSGGTKSKSALSPYDEMSSSDDHSLLFCYYTKE